MVFDVGVALTWLLYLALFPMAFFWIRRAWRILVKRDFSEVALKRGVPPQVPARWAPYAMLINGIAGAVATFVIVAVAAIGLPYDTWTAMAGSTVWCKFFLDFALSRQAHAADARAAAAAAKAAGPR
jgi:small-conductance mechanosensitive channel